MALTNNPKILIIVPSNLMTLSGMAEISKIRKENPEFSIEVITEDLLPEYLKED